MLDSNIVIDLAERSGAWFAWSRAAIGDAAETASLVINAIVLAETATHFASSEAQLAVVRDLGLVVLDLTPAAAFRAGRAHRVYRERGGKREAVLADFLIGAHAVALGARLLTRDARRFRGYFPELELIAPETPDG